MGCLGGSERRHAKGEPTPVESSSPPDFQWPTIRNRRICSAGSLRRRLCARFSCSLECFEAKRRIGRNLLGAALVCMLGIS